jgi:hypothetical protein
MAGFFMRGRIGGMGADEAYREAWRKFKASVQAELSELLVELERLGLDKPAAAIRRVAVSPEDHFGSAGDWEFGIIDIGRKLSSDTDIPQNIRLRLQQVAKRVPYNPALQNNPPSAH